MVSSGSSQTGANSNGLGDYGVRYPLDPNADPADASEFGWGAGHEPASERGKPYAEGGGYRGTTPDCELNIGIG